MACKMDIHLLSLECLCECMESVCNIRCMYIDMTFVAFVTLFLNKILNILEKSIQYDNISSKTTLVLTLCKIKYF